LNRRDENALEPDAVLGLAQEGDEFEISFAPVVEIKDGEGGAAQIGKLCEMPASFSAQRLGFDVSESFEDVLAGGFVPLGDLLRGYIDALFVVTEYPYQLS